VGLKGIKLVIVQGKKKVERQAGERNFGTKSDQETSCEMNVSLVFRKHGGRMLSVCIVMSLEREVDRRIYAVNCFSANGN
jgi:hypothetical protein